MDEAPAPAPDPARPAPAPAGLPPPEGLPRKKKKDRVRSAWISFIGRIVAQVVGAIASIVLAVMFIQRSSDREPPPAAGETPPAATTAPARSAPADGRITIAVLPLSNYSASGEDYFADGMTEALIADLAQIPGLRVISRTSAMQYRNTQKSLPQIAAELGAEMVVEGSVLRDGDRVRVTAQLIHAARDEHLWAHNYERRVRDVLSLQGEVARAIAQEVKGAITPLQAGRLGSRRAVDPVVYELYLRGRQAWSLRTDEGFDAAVSYFEQAIARDPTFALAHAGLSDVYVLPSTRPQVGAPAHARAKALAEATRALELDDTLAEAHTSRAALYFFHDRNRAAAEQEFRRALELNPGYPTARQWYAILLAEAGRDAEALTHAREAVALDPLSGPMRQALGLVHYYGRRYPEALSELQRAMALSPQLPLARAIMAKALFQQRAFAEAVAVAEGAPQPRSPDLLTILGLSHRGAGNTAAAEALLRQLQALRPMPTVSLAQWYAVIGDRDAAMRLLERPAEVAVAPNPVSVDPLFDGVRADPRFIELVARGRL